jgi:hypothetical protein
MSLLPRLLTGVADGDVADLRSHLEVDGPLPDLRGRPPAQLIERSGRARRSSPSPPETTRSPSAWRKQSRNDALRA